MRVFITGAAGLIGAELVRQLAHHGHAVTALVHRNHALIDNHGAILPSRRDGPAPQPGEILTLNGDVRLPGFGLAEAPQIDLLVHAVALARASGARLLHISTAYVCGTQDGEVRPGDTGADFTNGYEASKAAAEALVRASGLPYAIARPSVVVGDWAEGRISRFENIYMIFKLIAEGRLRTLPATPHATLDLVPLDHVIAGLMALATRFDEFCGETVHLVAEAPTPIPAIGTAMARAGLGVTVFIPSAAFDLAALPAREARWHAAAASLYTAYLQRSPRFLADHPLIPICPPTDASWLDRLIRFACSAGFVRMPGSPQRTSG
jgi:nucleoside-diphosphate-sugar epimerase